MTKVIKAIWIIATTVLFLSVIWFLLGSTAFFNRGIDLVETVIFILVWIPALIIAIISWILLKKKWMPSNINFQIIFVSMIVICTIALSSPLIHRASPYGWLIPRVAGDVMQTTSDGKFEYRLELVNRLQRNNRVRLYVKNISTNEEMLIPLDLSTDIFGSIGGTNAIAVLRPTETENIYMLNPTVHMRSSAIRPLIRGAFVTFEIDMETRTARRIE